MAAVAAVAGLAAGICAPGAVAEGPPPINPGALPPDSAPRPPFEIEPANQCTITKASSSSSIPPAQQFLGLPGAWQFGRGAGQTVAVIDTGVARHPRLPNLTGAGDYVGTSDGTQDCDAHGTAVAGLIGGQPAPGDGFSGVAPEAEIIAIRQLSELYRAKGTQPDPNDPKNGGGVGNTTTLAQAVRHAADMGATVINLSEVACGPPSLNDAALGAAVQYAATVRDIVVVASSGNNDNKACTGNPGLDPIHPGADPWASLTTAVTPAWYDQYVLSVGAVDLNGQPSQFTVPGPWVGVAAPGEQIVSLDPTRPGLMDGTVAQNGESKLAGTSFAAPYVAGLAALVRSRFPQLSASQVIARIEATAQHPPEGWNTSVGFGTIDPLAALTHEVDPNDVLEKKPTAAIGVSAQLPVPAEPPEPDHTARNVALIGTATVGVIAVLGYLASFPLRRMLGSRDDD